jgi:hypothetical protein
VARRRAVPRAAAVAIVGLMVSGSPVRAVPPAGREEAWSATAFGLALSGSLVLDSLTADAAGEGRPVRLEQTSRAVVDDRWRAARPRVLLRREVAGGGVGLTVEQDTRSGYRVWAPRHGAWLVAPDGRTVTGAPPAAPRWRWERLVLAQALPLASVLRGLEVLHASAVALDGRAIAFLGPSGAGKTTLAMHLLARGARLVTDDVLAVTAAGGSVTAHRGGAVARIDAGAVRAMSAGERAALGRVEARGAKWHVRPPRGPRAVALGALYVVVPAPAAAGLVIERVRPLDPGLLLGSAFLPYLDAPERLRRQLDVVAALAADVPLFRLHAPWEAGPRAAADAVAEHARSVLRGLGL